MNRPKEQTKLSIVHCQLSIVNWYFASLNVILSPNIIPLIFRLYKGFTRENPGFGASSP